MWGRALLCGKNKEGFSEELSVSHPRLGGERRRMESSKCKGPRVATDPIGREEDMGCSKQFQALEGSSHSTVGAAMEVWASVYIRGLSFWR